MARGCWRAAGAWAGRGEATLLPPRRPRAAMPLRQAGMGGRLSRRAGPEAGGAFETPLPLAPSAGPAPVLPPRRRMGETGARPPRAPGEGAVRE